MRGGPPIQIKKSAAWTLSRPSATLRNRFGSTSIASADVAKIAGATAKLSWVAERRGSRNWASSREAAREMRVWRCTVQPAGRRIQSHVCGGRSELACRSDPEK
eukprot:985905-Pleurochrysis_carterae.AAC.1